MGHKTMLQFINAAIAAEERGGITKEEFTRIRNNGSPEEIQEAVERMAAAGGYDNLD